MQDQYVSMLLFGPPGVGKGTQGKVLGKIPGMVHLATGDIFRSLDKSSPLGKKFVEFSSRGELVPDELTIELWQQYVQSLIEKKKYSLEKDLLILDGIPRSSTQAHALDSHIEVMCIVHLTAPNIDDMVMRMKRRAEQEGRHDDADESVIRRRFEVYEAETRPVLSHYDRALVSEVNAIGTPVEVLLRILKAIVPAYSDRFGNPLEI